MRTVPNSRALGAGAAGACNMHVTCAAAFSPEELGHSDDTPETEISEMLHVRDYQSRRRLLRSAGLR